MRFLRCFLYSAATMALIGCGGGGAGSGPSNAEISGIVTDFEGNAVRNATVWINEFGETDTNSSGSYVLKDLREGDWRVRAEIIQDGIRYKGENIAQVFSGDRTKSVNITVARENQLMRVHGQVITNQGFTVTGAKVFAIPTEAGSGVYSSTFDITGSDGQFDLDSLIGGVDYKIVASAPGYNSDVDLVNIPAGDSEDLILTLKNATDPLLPAPTGLSAVSWTTPSEVTRSPQDRAAIQNLKRLYDPRTPKKTVSRDTSGGNWIEVDLFWDPYPDNAAHLGFGIWRRKGSTGLFDDPYYLRDTEAETFIDSDEIFHEFETWEYVIYALNTNFDETNNSESDPSNIASAETLGDLTTNPVLQGPLRFRWQTGSGAEEYIVYLFDEYPGIGVSSIWNNSASPATGTEVTYSGGPSLQSGKRYYYMVIGLANSDTSRTISRVDSFIAN